MDIDFIEKVAKIVKDNGLTVIDLKLQDSKLHIERNHPSVISAKGDAVIFENSKTAESYVETSGSDETDLTDNRIKSPMVGVFYSSPSPESQPYVKVGDVVKAGDVLCIVEAMKLMNEIVSTYDGEVKSICAADGEVVEYGQTLFTIG
ncbi:MAG: acetyl-CoA carboxylase biotin carboxyl carrier protein [Ruminococcaceae bacterium]|nr:acetyl-CoA carboxylase biotin carboxyl carrier protein [Oscillospiraceae bacterium]